MIRIKEIINELKNVVGWEQSYNPETFIDERLTKTESGLYFQGAHPLLTLDNMRSIMPDDWGLQYPEWNLILPFNVSLSKKSEKMLYGRQYGFP